jgi:hypothetical protein
MRTCEAVPYSAPKSSPLYPIPPFLVQRPHPGEEEEEEEEGGLMIVDDYGRLSETLICRDALMEMIGVGTLLWWTTVTNHRKNHTLPSHKLK